MTIEELINELRKIENQNSNVVIDGCFLIDKVMTIGNNKVELMFSDRIVGNEYDVLVAKTVEFFKNSREPLDFVIELALENTAFTMTTGMTVLKSVNKTEDDFIREVKSHF
jgi:hypothetical protein